MTQETKADKPNEKGFRDKLATIDDKGKRLWVFAKIPKGKLTTYRNIPILSPEKELINYLFKKLDKNDLTIENFNHLSSLYKKSKAEHDLVIARFFQNQSKLDALGLSKCHIGSINGVISIIGKCGKPLIALQ